MSALNSHRRPGSQTSTLRKVLMSLMVVGAIGTTVGSGTFATFNGTTTNDTSTFASGSIILSNYKTSGTACLSSGGSNEAPTNTTVVNGNVRTDCDVLFDSVGNADHSSMRPGEYAAVDLHLKNVGDLPGTLAVQSAADCAALDPEDQPLYGTGNPCDAVQVAIQDATTCYWGDNMTTTGQAPYLTSAPLTYPVVITASSNDRYNITVDGVTKFDVGIAAGSYANATALASAINTGLTAAYSPSGVGVTTAAATAPSSTNAIRFTSVTTGGTANITVNIPTTASRSAVKTLGFIDGSRAAGPGKCATGSGDDAHTLADFRTGTTTTPLTLGALAAGGTVRDFTITVGVPSIITDVMQGRMAGFELTWILTA